MVKQAYLPLWQKIASFALDEGTAAVPFSAKLSASQGWSVRFTGRAIEEYRKFLLLCCISEKGAAPSHTVDIVWHLHLTYTQSYWTDLCKGVLGRELHHYPSAGGDEEDEKHRGWYQETLDLYRTAFGTEPPADIWPAPRRSWPAPTLIPEDRAFSQGPRARATIAGIIVLPFLFIWIAYGSFNPFSLNGSQFLGFFPLYGAAIVLAYIAARQQLKKQLVAITAAHFPRDASPFQVAAFLYGKHRATQAGLVDLIKRDLVELDIYSRFVVKSRNYRPVTGEKNPMIPAYAQEPDGSAYPYDSILINWYDRAKFAHPDLEVLDQFAHRDEPMRAYLFHVAFFGMVVARATQGIVNGRPIIFLVLETVGLSILLYLTQRQFSRSHIVYGEVKRLYKEHMGNTGMEADAGLVPNFALQGMSAISGFSEAAMLDIIFSSYDPRAFRSSLGDGNSSAGSSCGGSSGCSGGSSCGGGGCGGCGGGGD